MGLAEPGNFPAATKAVQEWFPPEQRATAVGLFNAGSSLGAAISAPVTAFLTIHYGWRSAFFFTGALGFAWAVMWLIIYPPPNSNRWLPARERRNPPGRMPESAVAVDGLGDKANVLRVLRSRQCYTLILARFFTDPVIYFIIFWFPGYLEKVRGFNLAMVGKYAWVPFAWGGVGYLFGGWLSGRLMRTGWRLAKARKTALLVGACFLPSAILVPLVASPNWAIFATCFVVFGHSIWIANLLTLPTDLFGSNEVGTAAGFSGMGGGISGVMAALGTGFVVTQFSYRPIFVLAGLMHPLSMALIFWLLPDREFPNTRGAPAHDHLDSR